MESSSTSFWGLDVPVRGSLSVKIQKVEEGQGWGEMDRHGCHWAYSAYHGYWTTFDLRPNNMYCMFCWRNILNGSFRPLNWTNFEISCKKSSVNLFWKSSIFNYFTKLVTYGL